MSVETLVFSFVTADDVLFAERMFHLWIGHPGPSSLASSLVVRVAVEALFWGCSNISICPPSLPLGARLSVT